MKKSFDFKSLFVGIITGSLLFGGIVGASTLITDNVYLNKYAVTVDGKSYTPTAPLLNYAGTTYVPLREFGTITGSNVSFSNNTIVVKNPTASSSTTTPSTGNTSTGSTSTSTTTSLNGKKITMDAGDTDSFYVDLTAANAKSATITITSGSAYASVSKTSLTTSGLITVTGKKEGSAIIKVTYSTGKSDVISVTVGGSDEIKLDVGDYEYIEIDLDEYDADKATLSITSGSGNIKLAKTTVESSTDVKVTGLKAGEATVKVKYDSGDTVYYDFVVSKGSSSNSDSDEIEIEIVKSNEFVYYVDLEEFDADKATIYVDDEDECLTVTLGSSTKVTSSKSTTSSKTLTIAGKATGSGEVEIEFDTGDIFTIYVDVVSKTNFDFDDYYDNAEDEFEIEKDDWDEFTIDPDDYDADWATISVIAGYNYITVSDTYIDKKTDIEIDGDDDGDAVICVTYSTGDVEYYYVEVVD